MPVPLGQPRGEVDHLRWLCRLAEVFMGLRSKARELLLEESERRLGGSSQHGREGRPGEHVGAVGVAANAAALPAPGDGALFEVIDRQARRDPGAARLVGRRRRHGDRLKGVLMRLGSGKGRRHRCARGEKQQPGDGGEHGGSMRRGDSDHQRNPPRALVCGQGRRCGGGQSEAWKDLEGMARSGSSPVPQECEEIEDFFRFECVEEPLRHR